MLALVEQLAPVDRVRLREELRVRYDACGESDGVAASQPHRLRQEERTSEARGAPRDPATRSQMAFTEWATAIVAGVRRYLPAARAARQGRSQVIIRHDGREAHLRDEGSVCTITFVASSPGATMASLSDQRRDLFTTRNLAKSTAGCFDARHSMAD